MIKTSVVRPKVKTVNTLNVFKSTELVPESATDILFKNITSQLSEHENFVLDKPIYVFYHIYCANGWVEILEDQVNLMKESGLYDTAKKLFFVVNGDQESYDFITKKYADKKIKFSKVKNKYEYPTIELIKKLSKKENFKGVYIHTKGSSKKIGTHSNYWRKVMDFYNISLWKYNYTVLDSYDIAGCNFSQGGTPVDKYWANYSTVLINGWFKYHTDHFAGNFWWFNPSYVNKLRDLTPEEKNNRWNAEWYIFMGKPKYFTWATPRNVSYFLRDTEYQSFINLIVNRIIKK
jgi:hypothetical protein